MPRRQIEDGGIGQACPLIDGRGELLVTSSQRDRGTESAESIRKPSAAVGNGNQVGDVLAPGLPVFILK